MEQVTKDDSELMCAWRLSSGAGGGTSAVKDLPDRRSWQQVVATQEVGDVAADWNDYCHDEMRQRRESSALVISIIIIIIIIMFISGNKAHMTEKQLTQWDKNK